MADVLYIKNTYSRLPGLRIHKEKQ